MKKNVIFEALAFLEDYETSPSISSTGNSSKIKEVYIKNAIISLLTIKENNLDSDVALILNFDLEKKWIKLLTQHSILLYKCPFNSYRMPPHLTYSLSYYKLCAFEFMLNNSNYEKFCFVDCDTICFSNFKNIWREIDNAFLIIPNDSTINAKIRKEICNIYKIIYDEKIITHISSGFIAAKSEEIESVLKKCKRVYEQIIFHDILPQGGDEIIWSIALDDYRGKIYCPRGYVLLSNIGIREYWVDKNNFEDEDIVIWHLPAEKRYGLIWAYNYYIKNEKSPNRKELAKACRIRHIKNHFTFSSILAFTNDPSIFVRNVMKIMHTKR